MHCKWRRKNSKITPFPWGFHHPAGGRPSHVHRQHAQKLVMIARVVPVIALRTDRQTHTQTHTQTRSLQYFTIIWYWQKAVMLWYWEANHSYAWNNLASKTPFHNTFRIFNLWSTRGRWNVISSYRDNRISCITMISLYLTLQVGDSNCGVFRITVSAVVSIVKSNTTYKLCCGY